MSKDIRRALMVAKGVGAPADDVHPASQIPGVHISERIHGKPIFTGERAGKAGGGSVSPKKTVKAYKLFRTIANQPGKLFPLFVDANTPVPMNKWVEAKAGDPGKTDGKVKSNIGDLAYRPGWHAGDLPVATHIGKKSDPDLTAPDYRPDNHVWAEVEMAADKDWQSVADARAKRNKAGEIIPNTAHITDQVPLKGFYRYKTNPNMTGNWLIGGHMKVNRVLPDDEVKKINDAAGVADLPRRKDPEGFADGGTVPSNDIHVDEGIIAYQGGPHSVGPEGYDNAKIGTGEGFHAEGHGHYFAEAEPAAKWYRNTLAWKKYLNPKEGEELGFDPELNSSDNKMPVLFELADRKTGHRIDKKTPGYELVRTLFNDPSAWEGKRHLDEHRYLDDETRQVHKNSWDDVAHGGWASEEDANHFKGALGLIDKVKGVPEGHMHQVRIHARPEHFLDWDKPLSEQSDHVRAALSAAPDYIKSQMPSADLSDKTGADIYRNFSLAHQAKAGSHTDADRLASEALSRLGVRGVRYLDQISRRDPLHSTRNYVVFDPKHIEVQRRYARGGMAYADGGSTPDAGVQKALDLTRDLNPQGLYSHAAEAAMASPQAKGPLPQMLASLKGVKPDELKYSGVQQAFADKPRVTREELAQHFSNALPVIREAVRETGGNPEPKYSDYTLPGGENYREVIMHLNRTPGEVAAFVNSLRNKYGDKWFSSMTDEEEDAKDFLVSQTRPYEDYRHDHWPQRNVVAHLRLKDRTGPNGEKILHAEEIQSDWGQAARREGTYNSQRPYQVFETNTGKVLSEHARPEEAEAEALKHRAAGNEGVDHGHAIDTQTDKEPVPDAPYIGNTQNWTDLALKRLLHEAAAGGYDKVVYTPGAEQAKRYGKGDSDGMEGYYDKIVPKSLLALARQHDPDAKLEAHGIAGLKPHLYDKDQDHEYAENLSGTELSRAQAQAFNKAYRDLRNSGTSRDDSIENALAHAMRTAPDADASLPGLTITPRMRESILKRGFKAYARGGDVEGTTRVGKAGGGSQDDDTVKKALALTASQKVTDHPAWIPTRLVTSKKAGPQGKNVVDLASLKATPDLYEKNVGLLKDYPNIRAQFAGSSSDDVAKEFIRHATENLLALHDAVPEHIRNRSKLWYDGARAITDRWSQEYGLPDHSIAGVLAALSPQKDWYQNVSLAKRVLNTMRGNGENFYHGFTFSPEMEAAFRGRDKLNKPKYEGLLNMVKGKSLGDIDKGEGSPQEKSILKAFWVRMHDEAHSSPEHPIITPEGNEGELVKTTKGENARVGWGSMTEIAKAIRAIEAQNDPDALSALMGEKHKVRNFYNNILVPNSRHGDITADTHAVAAALYRPLSGQSTEVAHNFANSTGPGIPAAGGSALTGIQGTYPLYAEAYRKAAKARGILPREMQSITWEAVRGLFPDTFKTAKNNKAVDAIWNQYKAGKIPQSEARRQVDEIAGGIRNPTWHVEGNAGPNETGGHPVDPRKLSGTGTHGEPAQAPDAGAGVGSPLAVPQERLTEAHGGAVSRALQIALQHGSPLPDAVNFARQHTRGRP